MSPTYKRWYDHDPLLLEVIDLLRNYQTELKAQAEIFLKKIEEKVSKETIDKFYAMVKPVNATWSTKDMCSEFYKNPEGNGNRIRKPEF